MTKYEFIKILEKQAQTYRNYGDMILAEELDFVIDVANGLDKEISLFNQSDVLPDVGKKVICRKPKLFDGDMSDEWIDWREKCTCKRSFLDLNDKDYCNGLVWANDAKFETEFVWRYLND